MGSKIGDWKRRFKEFVLESQVGFKVACSLSPSKCRVFMHRVRLDFLPMVKTCVAD